MSKHKPNQSPLKKTDSSEHDNFEPELLEVLEDLPKPKREIIIHALSIRRSHSGPLPDGETIKVYNEVIPNGGDRLMTSTETQLKHRIEIERTGVKRTFNQSSTGQWMGFIIAIIFGVIAWDLARSGHAVVATILGTVDLVALVSVFIIGRSK